MEEKNRKHFIKIRGANEHNLKNVDLDIPREELVVLTGLSGSGKSSLAFDTIYAEGQRRYMESLSSYARQFLGQMEKPDVESIEAYALVYCPTKARSTRRLAVQTARSSAARCDLTVTVRSRTLHVSPTGTDTRWRGCGWTPDAPTRSACISPIWAIPCLVTFSIIRIFRAFSAMPCTPVRSGSASR